MTISAVDFANASTVAAQWIGGYESAAADATRLLGLVSQLPGNFGRYVSGANLGYLAGNAGPYAADTTVDQLVTDATAQRAAVSAAAVACQAAIDGMGAEGDFSAAPTAVEALAAALLAACADPADAVRLFAGLAAFEATGPAAASVAGGAVQSLFAVSSAVTLAQAARTYQPASADDALSVMAEVVATLDAQILAAGNTGQDALFSALRALRTASVQDLQARGADLSPIVAFAEAIPLPALAVAQQLYRDGSRADQLVIQADPVHPLFMPTAFQALAQ